MNNNCKKHIFIVIYITYNILNVVLSSYIVTNNKLDIFFNKTYIDNKKNYLEEFQRKGNIKKCFLEDIPSTIKDSINLLISLITKNKKKSNEAFYKLQVDLELLQIDCELQSYNNIQYNNFFNKSDETNIKACLLFLKDIKYNIIKLLTTKSTNNNNFFTLKNLLYYFIYNVTNKCKEFN